MAINDDRGLLEAVARASALIQDIHDYCGRNLRDDSKINFPRGLIGTAASYRGRCPGYLTADQMSSCAYGFMYLDVLWWLLARTDLASVGKQMAIKSALVTLGTLVEVCLWIPTLPSTDILSKKSQAGVLPRLKEATRLRWISEKERGSLNELWAHRNNVHLKFLANSELDLYKLDHVNAALAALLTLMSNLKAWHEEFAAKSLTD
jgi:hypothetical protein